MSSNKKGEHAKGIMLKEVNIATNMNKDMLNGDKIERVFFT